MTQLEGVTYHDNKLANAGYIAVVVNRFVSVWYSRCQLAAILNYLAISIKADLGFLLVMLPLVTISLIAKLEILITILHNRIDSLVDSLIDIVSDNFVDNFTEDLDSNLIYTFREGVTNSFINNVADSMVTSLFTVLTSSRWWYCWQSYQHFFLERF